MASQNLVKTSPK